MYVFGRYQYRRQIKPSGEVLKQVHAVSMAEWRVSLQKHHEGYINWDEYLKNQERLEKNRTNGGAMMLSGPAREGLALLQGLLCAASVDGRSPYVIPATAVSIPAICATCFTATAWPVKAA